MPELPEVETIRRGLEAPLVGRSIASVEVRVPKLFIGDSKQIIGQPIIGLERFGKLLCLSFENEYVLTVHLKMTGQLIFRAPGQALVMGGHPEKAYLDSLPHKHTHVIITFTDGAELFFNDLRKFGFMQVLPATEVESLSFIQRLGPEPLEREFTRQYLQEQLLKKKKSIIKTFLLDQSNIAGLGNIYADESLFRAAILPYRLAGDLTSGEVNNLYDAIQETLELALMYGGSSERDYLTATGDKGTYLRIANVYHRTGQECNRCADGIIERIKIGGRSSHFCATCQY